MKLDLKQPELSIRNEYTLQLFDEDNNLLQEVKCHNAASNRWFTQAIAMYGYNRDNGSYRSLYLVLGDGTGEINIENSTEYLFHKIFSKAFNGGLYRITKESNEFSNIHYQAVVSFPPTTSYVGDLTEIGITYYSSDTRLISHSLLFDAEGNPIVIKKTSTNILIVTIDLFFSVKLLEQPYNFKYFAPWASQLTGMRYCLGNSDWFMYPGRIFNFSVDGACLPYPIIDYFYLSPYYCGTDVNSNGQLISPVTISSNGYNTSSMYVKLTYPDSLPSTANITNKRWETKDNNISFAHSIVCPGVGAIPLPNHEICPPYEYKDITVGTGDGVSSTFLPYINEVVSVTGYVDGAIENATFINFDPRKSSLWNKCIKVLIDNIEYPVPGHDIWISSNNTQTTSYRFACCPAILSEHTHGCKNSNMDSGGGFPAFFCSSSSKSFAAYIFYDEAGIWLDHLRVGKMRSGSYAKTPTVTIFYSNDGEQWEQSISISEAYKVFYFERTQAKYWKIQFSDIIKAGRVYDYSVWSHPDQEVKNGTTQQGIDPKFFVAGDSQEFDFGKCGITFETPPPEGAIITMDAILDLPYKDTDIVMTMSVEAEQPHPNEVTV